MELGTKVNEEESEHHEVAREDIALTALDEVDSYLVESISILHSPRDVAELREIAYRILCEEYK